MGVVFLGLLMAIAGCDRTQTQQSMEPTAEEAIERSDHDKEASGERALADVDVQGHRGARGLKPENTLPSFEAALDLEVDTLELDLHLSKDDALIIWHDPYVYDSKCRANAPNSRLQLRPATEDEPHQRAMVRRLATGLLGRFQCDKNPSPERFPDQDNESTELAGSNYRIVTLEELFTFVERYAQSPKKSDSQRKNAASVRFNIETKRKPEHPEYIGDGFDGTEPATFEHKLVELIGEHGLLERVTVQSFVPESLWAAAQLEADLRLAVLEKSRQQPLADYADRGASVWSPRASLVDRATIDEARKAGLLVKPWTVNDPAEMRRLIELGVDGIITDRPDLLLEELQRSGKAQ